MIIGLFGTVFLVALTTGFLHVRAGRVALHREWMIRAFAVGLSIATQRLIFFPALWIVEADPTDGQFAALWVAAFVAAFVLNLLVAEARIRATAEAVSQGQLLRRPHESRGSSGGATPGWLSGACAPA